MLYFSCVLCSLLYLENRTDSLLTFIPFSVLIKTDLIIYSVLIYIFIFFIKKPSKYKIIVSSLATFILYFYVNFSSSNYGYAKLFYYTFIDRVKYPASIEYSYSVRDHFFILFNRINDIIINYDSWGSSLFLFMIILFVLISYRLIQNYNFQKILELLINNPLLSLIYLNYFYIIIHFFLFPRPDIRFFSANYSIIVFSVLNIFSTSILSEKK